MSLRLRTIVVLAVLLGFPAIGLACLWDYDTLRQERRRFPTALELITGKFPRHSTEFYAWRIQDRLRKLKADPANLAHYDDLAVAYEKTGQHAKAIDTMLAKEKLKPGLYETYANLGTFHILAGEFVEGLPYIDKALAINPDAHFSRERYQKWLVEYAILRRTDGKLSFPMQQSPVAEVDGKSIANFHEFVRLKLGQPEVKMPELQKAVKGVQGMMLFANHDNPLLLEALGDLLVGNDHRGSADAKQLAARAYRQAAHVMKDEAAREGYRKLAEKTLMMQILRGTDDEYKLQKVQEQLAAERAAAEKWYAELKSKELGWIRDGKDADAEFDRVASAESSLGFYSSIREKFVIGGGIVAFLSIGLLLLRRLNRRIRVAPASSVKHG